MPLATTKSRAVLLGTGALAAVALLGGCTGSAPGPAESGTGGYPAYYPDDYQDLVEAAEAESGTLTIYSSMQEENWAPIIAGFREKYPFVTSVTALNLEGDELFQRQLSEESIGNAPADLLSSPSVSAWVNYTERSGVIEYESAEHSELPEAALALPGVYALSIDPQVLSYNTALISDELESWGDLADALEGGDFDGKIGIRDPELSSFNFTVQYTLLTQKPELWDTYGEFIALGRSETSTGAMNEKTISGEYVASVFVTAGGALETAQNSGGLYRLVMPSDGVVATPRPIGIPASSENPNTAKLMLDYILSVEGQQAVQDGGLAAFRDGVIAPEGGWTYQDAVDEVGDAVVTVPVPFTAFDEDSVAEFLAKWNSYKR